MNFNFNHPYIEDDSENIPSDLYEIYGVSKINELSRQLQTFLNCKAATIKYRFSLGNIALAHNKDEKYKKIISNLESLASKFIKLLRDIQGSGVSYENELKKLLDKIILKQDKISRGLLIDLKDVTQKLFTNIHIISDQEIYVDSKFLKFIINLIQKACIVFKHLNCWASGFYEELGVNYTQLHDEFTSIIQSEQQDEYTEKKILQKKKSLEEGLKEW